MSRESGWAGLWQAQALNSVSSGRTRDQKTITITRLSLVLTRAEPLINFLVDVVWRIRSALVVLVSGAGLCWLLPKSGRWTPSEAASSFSWSLSLLSANHLWFTYSALINCCVPFAVPLFYHHRQCSNLKANILRLDSGGGGRFLGCLLKTIVFVKSKSCHFAAPGENHN